jgi:hypothetical protein
VPAESQERGESSVTKATTKPPDVVSFDTEDEACDEVLWPAAIAFFRAIVIYHQYRNGTDQRLPQSELRNAAHEWIDGIIQEGEFANDAEFYRLWVECKEPLPKVMERQ